MSLHRALKQPVLAALAALPLALAIIAAGLVAFVTEQTTSNAPAQAARLVMAHHGRGYQLGSVWFGTWTTSRGSGFCIDFDRSDPDSSGAGRITGRVPARTSEESAEVKFIANKYGSTSSALDAAAGSVFVWRTQHLKRFDSYYKKLLREHAVPAKLQERVATMAVEARSHGPYKLTMRLGAGYVGQAIAGTVTVRAANGKAAPSLPLQLTINGNGTLAKGSRTTNRSGVVSFGARVARIGVVRTGATLVTPSTKIVYLSRPSGGHQRLVIASTATDSAKVSAASVRSTGGPTVSSVCDTNCSGMAKVSVSMKNVCGSAPLREIILANGRPVADGTFDVAACKTATKTVSIADNSVVTTSYCYVTAGRCVGAPVANRGSLTVVCPPWVQYRFTGTCPCGTTKTITYAVQAPATSTRSYTAALVTTDKAGKHTQTLTLTNGVWQSFTPVALARGTEVQLSFTAMGQTHVLDDIVQQV